MHMAASSTAPGSPRLTLLSRARPTASTLNQGVVSPTQSAHRANQLGSNRTWQTRAPATPRPKPHAPHIAISSSSDNPRYSPE